MRLVVLLRPLVDRIRHKFSTAATPPSSERSEEIIRSDCATRKRVPPTHKRVPLRVAQRTQAGAFTLS